MKIQKQKQIDYDGIGYGESNGWQPMYDWDKIKKTIRLGNIAMLIVISAALFFLARLAGSKLSVAVSALVYLLVVIPVHEILHLAACTPNIFSGKCIIFVGVSAVSAFYDGEITRGRSMLSVILPFAAITAALGLVGVFAADLRIYAAIVALMNAGGSWTDIHMFFHMRKHIPKNSIVYGNRFKVQV